MSPSSLQPLPIDQIADQIVQLSRSMAKGECPARAVLQAPTGSGKSTRVGAMLVDGGAVNGDVLVLQPRRMAARMLARRVAYERGTKLGTEVGYQVRFDRVGGKDTRLWFVTEGILLRRLLASPELRGVGAVVFDEFHERHLDADLGIALLSQLQRTKRPDLQLWVMSATLDHISLDDWCPPEQRLESHGRTFPVEIEHVRHEPKVSVPVWMHAVAGLREMIANRQVEGDALVFMPGRYEITKTLAELKSAKWAKGMDLLPLYGDMRPEDQDAVLADTGRRKIVVATNVAETSLTIPGIRIVVDSGLARIADYDPKRGLNTLMVEPISRASADQRAGRAGRVAEGHCLRLWTAANHSARSAQLAPEIDRLDLSGAFLSLAAAGYGDLGALDWVEKPKAGRLEHAVETLVMLLAVEAEGEVMRITEVGRQMAAFPVHPRWARVLVDLAFAGLGDVGCRLVALAEGRGIWASKNGPDFNGRGGASEFVTADDDSDLLPMMRALDGAIARRFDMQWCRERGVHAGAAREAAELVRQLDRVVQGLVYDAEVVTPENEWDAVKRALLAAFPDHVAVKRSAGSLACSLGDGRSGKMKDGSLARKSSLVIAGEIAEISGRDVSVVLGMLSAVNEDDLQAVWPQRMRVTNEDRFDPRSKRVVRFAETRFGDLVLRSSAGDGADRLVAAEILAAKVMAGEMVLKNWNDRVEQWIARVQCVANHLSELGISPIDDEARQMIITEVCEGGYSQRDIKDRDVWTALRNWLSPEQRSAIDYYAPETIKLENGQTAKVRYSEAGVPEISMVLQRLYDIHRHPTIADGKVPVVVHILAPNQRPAQTTTDLGAFWTTSYEAVKKDLKGRYPKHEWR
ncbi:ATP-dependent RNA helicase [Sulfuriroseicoccus oceanibius]|uniref:Uncharacterized protein n=1 Tax=Sulfuriroseicoccus oceanibius TaxID=2707525 RepID=A0A6B3L8C6_9BACT|nr:ATP-dependent helicase C-terminal domain-containing protein [Sulfuriroseicoccus oceanibius]QQL43685.1 hypothetical protein G3M56_007170 [Sulfuriroseicoccus oceanibius]